MKKYLINLSILLCIATFVRSQTVSSQPYAADGIGPFTGNFLIINRPSDSPPYPPYLHSGSWYIYNPKDSGKIAQPRINYFFEYGDGTYTTFDSTVHTYPTMDKKIALLTTRAKYDTIHPHSRITAYTITPSAFNPQASQQLLNTSVGKNIMLASDVGDLIADDTIQTVLTFRKTFVGSGKVLVYYNIGLGAFKAISNNSNDTIRVLPWISKIKAIRTYRDSLSVDMVNIIPATVGFQYGLPSVSSALPTRAFKYINDSIQSAVIPSPNVLVINLPDTFDQFKEHNIFITFVTNGNWIYNSKVSETSINAFILSDSLQLKADPTLRSAQLSPNSANLVFPIAQGDPTSSNPNLIRPHDPNYIVADKRCTDICNNSGNQRERFNYHVHFQNDGKGAADSIVISVYLHNKLDTAILQNSVSANVGGKPVIGNNLVVSSVQQQGVWNKIVFTLYNPGRINKNVNLIGTYGLSMPATDMRTMGDLRFSVNSKAGSNPSYYSIASIVFNTESPVITRMNRIRCCKQLQIDELVPVKPFGKKEKDNKGKSTKFSDKRKDLGNLRVNG